MSTEAKPSRPLVRYHGGKWLLADWIIANFPSHRIYVEPFGGGGSVLLQKPRTYAEVYNDLDGEMVNLFRVVRDHGHELADKLRLTPFARDEYAESFAVSKDPLEQARRTVVRSFMGFGSNALCRNIKSGFRANSNRPGTTPAHDWQNYPDALAGIIERLRGVVIENRPADEVMQAHDTPETLHYCDPPYVHSTRSLAMHGHHGYSHEMTDEQHREFAACVRGLSGMVIISGYDCELYGELFGDWHKVTRKALADGARDRVEVLWLNEAVMNSCPLLPGLEAVV
jgi:DNA adenine methylase